MKDTKNEINIDKIQTLLNKLILEVENTVEEHGYDNTVDAIINAEGDHLSISEGISVLNSAYVCSLPSWKEKRLSVGSAMTFVTDNHLLEYINLVDDALYFVESNEIATSSSNALDWRQAFRSLCDLKKMATSELYDRVQVYNHEIEELRK